MTETLRERIRQIIPAPLRRPLGYVENYAKRLNVWLHVMRELKGVSLGDKAVVWASFAVAPLTSLFKLAVWRDPELLWDAVVDAAGVGEFHVRAHSDDLVHVLPSREPEVYRAIKSALKPGDTFIDAGANVGFYTLLSARIVGPAGRVIAIEMMPDTAAILRRHVEQNSLQDIVEIRESAISDEADRTVTAYVHEGRFGQASISSALDHGQKTRVEVKTTTFHHVLSDVDAVRLMKIDLEGIEETALRGAGTSLGKVQSVLFETWAGNEDAERLLLSSGYRIEKLDARNALADQLTPQTKTAKA